MTTGRDIIERHAARIVVIDRDDRVLLFRCEEPGADRSFWITPGGGLEGEETHEQAARRELREEIGYEAAKLGPCIWTRSHTFPWLSKTYRQHERFYLLRIDGHEVDLAGHTEEELVVLTEHRWWRLDDLLTAQRKLAFAPRRIGDLLVPILRGQLPDTPVDVGA